MKPGKKNTFNSLKDISIDGEKYKYYSILEAEKNGLEGISKLPKSIKVLLENLLRYEDDLTVNQSQILAIKEWLKNKKSSTDTKKENPVKFIETFMFQYLNPKGVMVAIVVVSTYVDLGENYLNHATQVVLLALIFSSTSITLWTFIGKFLRKFATNEKFINIFNYVMSILLLASIITFYY